MRIYICVPEKIYSDASRQEDIRSGLLESLRKFYGRLGRSEIEFFRNNSNNISVYVMEKSSIPDSDNDIHEAVTRIIRAPVELRLNYQRINPSFKPDNSPPPNQKQTQSDKDDNEFDYEKLSRNYHAEPPHYTFEQVILPENVKSKILDAVATIQVEPKVFDEWGLRSIIPYATSAMSFYGPPGTGKTMAAEAVASMLGKNIIRAAYADIESKYHGEGPKMVKAVFRATERDDAVLSKSGVIPLDLDMGI